MTARTLCIEGELSIYRAAELKAVLLEALDGGAPLEIDLAGVTELDSAGVQLLMLVKQEAGRRGQALALVRHSPAVLDVFELLDLAAHFGDALLVPAASCAFEKTTTGPSP